MPTPPLAAHERAARARRHLSKRYGSLLSSWAAARAAEWQIDRFWSVADVLNKLERLRIDEVWTPIVSAGEEVATLDGLMRVEVRAFVSTKQPPEQADELNVDEVCNLMRVWFPNISRARVRMLLFRTERAGLAVRERRGIYLADEGGSIRRYRRDFSEDVDERMRRWERRRHRAVVALVVHYLLPTMPVYRKASALGMSDRSFYYALNVLLEEIDEHLEWQQNLARRKCAVLST